MRVYKRKPKFLWPRAISTAGLKPRETPLLQIPVRHIRMPTSHRLLYHMQSTPKETWLPHKQVYHIDTCYWLLASSASGGHHERQYEHLKDTCFQVKPARLLTNSKFCVCVMCMRFHILVYFPCPVIWILGILCNPWSYVVSLYCYGYDWLPQKTRGRGGLDCTNRRLQQGSHQVWLFQWTSKQPQWVMCLLTNPSYLHTLVLLPLLQKAVPGELRRESLKPWASHLSNTSFSE